MERAEVQREREGYERRSIGPVGSTVMLAAGRMEVFYKVRWKRLEPVAELAKATEGGIDCYSSWVVFAQDEVSLALECGWPDVGVNVVLFFEVEKWKTTLGLVRDGGGRLLLVPEGASGIEILGEALAVEPDLGMLTTALAVA